MLLTIVQTGEVPEPLRERFGPYTRMFERMFDRTNFGFSYRVVRVAEGEPLPAPTDVEGIVLTGSAAGVYETHAWLDPLRHFIRTAYAARVPMLGVCFGHQVMADALGGSVRKAERGWGLGRHVYSVTARPHYLRGSGASLAIACSHQDQVVAAPPEAEVILASDFTPYAGLAYRNGAALSLQPHPEFSDDYAVALCELRRGRAPDAVIDAALTSMATPSSSAEVGGYIARFFRER